VRSSALRHAHRYADTVGLVDRALPCPEVSPLGDVDPGADVEEAVRELPGCVDEIPGKHRERGRDVSRWVGFDPASAYGVNDVPMAR
jgi:hypothetical protein